MHRIPRVLIVEDEFLIALELESTLRSVGYHVLGPVATVQEALELLRTESPDAAVLDVNLAGERVTPVAELLRAMSVPFVLSSGYDKTDLRDEPMLRDAVNVGKPARSVLLLKELQEALPDLSSRTA